MLEFLSFIQSFFERNIELTLGAASISARKPHPENGAITKQF
jgi:hypothetical protein